MHTHHPLPSPSSSHPLGPMHTRPLGHNNSFDCSLTALMGRSSPGPSPAPPCPALPVLRTCAHPEAASHAVSLPLLSPRRRGHNHAPRYPIARRLLLRARPLDAAHASHERTLSSASGYAHHHVAGAAKSTTSPAKQRYIADMHGLEIVKKIRQGEVGLRDCTIVLCDIKANVHPARFAKLRAIKDAKKPGKAPTAIPAVSGLKRLRSQHRSGAGERGSAEQGSAARLVMSAVYWQA
ncbi:hypothetical protein HETIRDRAFT_450291 [Heterobasidion irregulare TC 32-1]|uniref:Uncharacterized protein n=1 Tax=Heterobasidion irregulare (strain TC 32-1) TaxID=747525 RepID=W4K9D2_HETIT|nr:uncharacterized protein HETIRDRAFT_450291 [Heterobasidion irregulare TC 32-1]XP_009553020.1 uncharacterized protein HETIRDRAFT_456169 [Heterobasidion irregulare TC 32-1]ETW75624.1 hypothetical protein HETIRDRAFT_456169 [Heterobasidion irregulare TC 32-1]ETW82388.1 hypothetical protein HETIRDRAFT_450291 [Heterobasidion irregulare TC 32-1]